ncbi:MAG: ABC transporter ATP-binding protein/permease [Firmicutes bacterium]|nr:ABC transporter ATP-binding protein/permease [Bacillota bacterium]
MLRLFSKLKPTDWILIVLLIGVSIGQAYFDVYMPAHSATLFDRMISGSSAQSLWQAGGLMLLYAGGSFLMNIIGAIISAFLISNLGRQIRKDLFKTVQSFGFEEMNKFSTPSLITRTTNDVARAKDAMVMSLRVAISSPITAIWAIVRISNASLDLTLLTALTVAASSAIMLVLTFLVLPKFRLIQSLTDKMNAVTRQNLTGLRVVKAYNAERYEQEKFDQVNKKLNKNHVFANSIMGVLNPLLMLVMNGITLAIFWLGAQLINQGQLNFPDLMEFSGLIMQVLMSFLMLGFLVSMVPRAQVSAKRVLQVLDTKPRVVDPFDENTVRFKSENKGEIEFENVSFSYPDAEAKVLDSISFKVKKGQTVAFIGSTGSGKSTLINLVPRFYDVTDGIVRVEGVDVKKVKQKDLRAKIGYVPQKGVLFGGTVASNIGYGMGQSDSQIKTDKNQSDHDKISSINQSNSNSPKQPDCQNQSNHDQFYSKLKQAALVASADTFIENLDDKYDSPVSQGGKNFSGGQKQRLSIARAVAADPDIFIFDDSFSALDYKTDKEVRENLKKHTKDATCLIVAQRIGTIMDADSIIVLEHGKVAGIGTHKDLLNTCAVYKEIALSQLTEEELK